MNSDVAAVEVSWPVPDAVEWFYNQDSVNLVNTVQNQYVFNFPYVGTFDLTMRAEAGLKNGFIAKMRSLVFIDHERPVSVPLVLHGMRPALMCGRGVYTSQRHLRHQTAV